MIKINEAQRMSDMNSYGICLHVTKANYIPPIGIAAETLFCIKLTSMLLNCAVIRTEKF